MTGILVKSASVEQIAWKFGFSEKYYVMIYSQIYLCSNVPIIVFGFSLSTGFYYQYETVPYQIFLTASLGSHGPRKSFFIFFSGIQVSCNPFLTCLIKILAKFLF